MYAENRGVVSGACPPEITIPTGSSVCACVVCFICNPLKRCAPGTVGGTLSKGSRDASRFNLCKSLLVIDLPLITRCGELADVSP